MLGRPGYQFFRRISPAKPERGLDDSLRTETLAGEAKEKGECAKRPDHGFIIRAGSRFRKPRTPRRGFALVEATMAMSMLSIVGLMLLKLSLNVIHPRQYALQQVLSDSCLTFERAKAERIPFETLLATGSPWPAYPAVASERIELGKLPGGMAITGTVYRTRIADGGNYPIDGGTGTLATNPAAMKIWGVQSILRYEISGRTYVKSRTVVRSQ